MILGQRTIGTIAYPGGLPSNLSEFTWCWGQMLLYTQEYLCQPGERIHPMRATTSEHAQARTGLSRNFLGDWLLQIDTDHAFEPDIACRMVGLLMKHDLDVLSATYTYKVHPHNPVLYDWDEGADGFKFKLSVDGEVPLFDIGCAGAGTLLVRRRVFQRIQDELGVGAFDVLGPYEEDFSFFRRCRQLGIKCHASARIQSHHLMVKPLSLDDYRPEAVMEALAQR